jgi:hypothetical protein
VAEKKSGEEEKDGMKDGGQVRRRRGRGGNGKEKRRKDKRKARREKLSRESNRRGCTSSF